MIEIYRSYDILWREAMLELLDQLEIEHPEDPSQAPKILSEWSSVYIRYLQIFHKLETAYDQMVHPQKRVDIKKALEACMGRLVEIRNIMVQLNKNRDTIQLDDALVDLKLSPDVLEVPVPNYFVHDRTKELEDREKFLEALVAKYSVGKYPEDETIKKMPPFIPDDSILIIQNNERGRQARERSKILLTIKRQRQLEDKRRQAGNAITQEEAVLKLQSALRGMIFRRKVKAAALNELVFVGMRPKEPNPVTDPQVIEAKHLQRRRMIQNENIKEYDDAIVQYRKKVKEMEGQDMREAIQDRINAWFVENRDPETGEYPEFPDQEEGGSTIILNPPPPTPEVAPEQQNDKKPSGGDKGKGKKDQGKKEEVQEEAQETKVASVFLEEIESTVANYVTIWQERDEQNNFYQKVDIELVKEEIRPLVFEEIRLKVDAEMQVMLQNLQDMVAAERAARSGKKAKKKKSKKKKGKKGKGGKGKAKKDPTADRSIESLYAELVSNGILQQIPKCHLKDYVGALNFLGATLEKADIIPDISMAQVRQLLTEYCILPLGSKLLHQKLPMNKAILLYGLPKTGKSLLTRAVANCTGANFFNLSPRNTDGKYPGKQVSLLIHTVFKVARVMSPSVIYIDEAEKIFIGDKKKQREFGGIEPFSRIKKDLLKEVKAMQPGEQVMIIGNTSEPFLATKKDEKALINFWGKHIMVPLPDYASRRLLIPWLIKQHGGQVDIDFDVATLAHICENYTSGGLDMAIKAMLSKRRLSLLATNPIEVREVIQWISKVQPISKEQDEILRKWAAKLPCNQVLLASKEGATDEVATDKAAKGKGKGKRK